MRSRTSTVLTGALGLCTTAVLVGMLALSLSFAPKRTEMSAEARNIEDELAEVAPQVVVLGNSMAGAGIDDDQLSARLGLPVATLSVAHSQGSVWYAVLKNRVYGNGYKPKLILVPAALYDVFGLSLHDRQAMTRLADQMSDDEPVLDRKVMPRAGSGFLTRGREWQDVVRRRVLYTLPNLIMGSLVGEPSERGIRHSGRVVTERALGRVFDLTQVDFTIQGPQPRFTTPTARDIAAIPTIEDSLVPDILDLAEQNDAKVVFIRVPVAPGNEQADPVSLEQERAFVDYLNARGAGYLDLWNMTLRPSDFQDPYHLDESGKARVTRQLGLAISQWRVPGGFEIPPAPTPRAPPRIVRIGDLPEPFPLYLEPSGRPECSHQTSVNMLADFADDKLSLVGLSGTAPFVVYQGDQPLMRRDEDAPGCSEGEYDFIGGDILITPMPDGAREFSLRVASSDQMLGANFGRAAQWIFPGTTLRYEFDEPWDPAVDGPFAINVAGQPFGNGRGRVEVKVDGRAGAKMVGHGGRLQAGLRRKAPEGPWAIEITSPPDGPFLALMALAVGQGEQRNLVIAARYQSEIPMVQMVGRHIKETQASWRSDPPRLPPAIQSPRLSPGKGGTGMFRVPQLAHLSDTTTSRCSPVVVFEDGRMLRRRHAPCYAVRNGAGAMCHANNTIIFNASDGSDPATNGRNYGLGIVRFGGKFCLTELWAYAGDALRVAMGPGDLRGLFAGANMLELSGLVGSFGETDPQLNVTLTVDGREIVNRKVLAEALNSGTLAIPLAPPVPPSASSVVLQLDVPPGGPDILLRSVVLAEMSPDQKALAFARWQKWLRWKKRQTTP